jgi:hypothetical protein
VVAVHDFPEAKIYVNGVLEKESTFDVNWCPATTRWGSATSRSSPRRAGSGTASSTRRAVLNVAKDEHWIKLDYESQREDGKLLSFGKTSRAPVVVGKAERMKRRELLPGGRAGRRPAGARARAGADRGRGQGGGQRPHPGGAIGVGAFGTVDLKDFLANDDVQVVAVCDVSGRIWRRRWP